MHDWMLPATPIAPLIGRSIALPVVENASTDRAPPSAFADGGMGSSKRFGDAAMIWENILVANIGWDKAYEGSGITSHHGYVVQHGTGAEAYNFSPVGGMFYGYVRDGDALGRFADRVWTIVFVSKPSEREKLRVVGWYEGAAVQGYGDRPEYVSDADFPRLGNGQKYIFSAVSKNAYIVPEDARGSLTLPAGHRIKSGGIYYAAGGDTSDYREQAADRIQMAEWLRSALPRLRDVSRVARPSTATVRDLTGISVDEGGHPHGFSPVGESAEHRALRVWVCDNPAFVTGDRRVPTGETETRLASADRVDATFSLGSRYWAVEVKSTRSDDADHYRGLYQCVKYRAVVEAMEDIAAVSVEAVLVTENPLTAEHAALAERLDVRHLLAPTDRPDAQPYDLARS